MQQCVWWTVYAKCVQPMWHLTCTQQQLAEIHVKIQFWSNLLGLLIGFHRVPSIQLMWFQRVSSVDVGGRCLYRAFAMHALAGCKLLSGCLKCCGTSSVKWRFFLIGAVLALFSSWSAVLPWLFESLNFSWTSWSAVLPWLFGTATSYSSSISGQIFFKLGLTSSDATTPLSGAQGEETEADLPPSRVL